MEKIITVNLNPCIDWVCAVPTYTHGGLNRVRRVRSDVAGKGINVAIALKNLGMEPLCMGFNFSENGNLLTEKLNTEGINHNFTETNGAIRVNIKLYEENTGIMTEINQQGAYVSEEVQKTFLEKIKTQAASDKILVISGSRPQGVAADFYASICKLWGGKIIVDTEGEALKEALNTKLPFAIKPNLYELESTFGVKCATPEEIKNFCQSLFTGNLEIICVSMGEKGAVLVTREKTYFCPVLNIKAKGLAGAGDAMVAGMVYAISLNLREDEILKTAMATAAASVILEGTQMCTKQDFSDMINIVPSIQIL